MGWWHYFSFGVGVGGYYGCCEERRCLATVAAPEKFKVSVDAFPYHRFGRIYGTTYCPAVEATDEPGTEGCITGTVFAGRVATVHDHPIRDTTEVVYGCVLVAVIGAKCLDFEKNTAPIH